MLPDRQRDLLRSISAYLRHRDRVLSEWGYERTVARTQGLKVLFAGESGTGKTMAAQVLAAELGLDLFRVDLATVVSKYIGETEKNLERIFTAADGSNAILFFDEADALFGKRSEVSDSHDRYANIEVAYLLQRMEAYPGAVILATNFKRNIDDAFVRRLDFVVDFPFPEAEDRKRIWRLVLPERGAGRRRRRPRLPGHPVQAVGRRDPQLLAGRGVPGRRRGRRDRDAAPRAGGGAGVRQAGPAHARGRLRAVPRDRARRAARRRSRPLRASRPQPAVVGGRLLVLRRVEAQELVGDDVGQHHALLGLVWMCGPACERAARRPGCRPSAAAQRLRGRGSGVAGARSRRGRAAFAWAGLVALPARRGERASFIRAPILLAPGRRGCDRCTVLPHGARRRRASQHGHRRPRRGAARCCSSASSTSTGSRAWRSRSTLPRRSGRESSPGPTVDLFLYDLREALDRAELTPTETRGNGVARVNSTRRCGSS